MNRFLNPVGVVVRHNALLIARDPGPLIGYTLIPVLLMTALRPMYEAIGASTSEGDGVARVASGMIVMSSLFVLNVIGHSLLNERSWNTWDRLRSAPVGVTQLFAGKVIPLYLVLLLQQIMILGFATTVLGLHIDGTWESLVIVMLVWSASVLALGLMLASLARSHSQLGMLADVAALMITVIGGALTPLSSLPHWMRQIAIFSPGYWGLSGFRSALIGPQHISFPVSVSVLLIISAVAACIAIRRVSRPRKALVM